VLREDYGSERGKTLNASYMIGSRIGEVRNSVIFNGLEIRTRQLVALKFNEPSEDDGSDVLESEYELLQHPEEIEGVIRAFYLSETMEDIYQWNDGVRFMVIER
jgi:hypothetical protein